MSFFANFFKRKKKKDVKELLKELSPGDLVHIKFKTPGEIGIVGEHTLTLTRLNPEEAAKKEVIGTIAFNKKMEVPLLTRVIEVVTLSSPSMPGIPRRITFLEDEIYYVRKIEYE